MEDETQGSPTLRDQIAIQAMKCFMDAQGQHRRMGPLSRLKHWLGLNGWRRDFDYNVDQIAETSYLVADKMIKARSPK